MPQGEADNSALSEKQQKKQGNEINSADGTKGRQNRQDVAARWEMRIWNEK